MVSYEMDASTVTTDFCVLEAKRQIWSIGYDGFSRVADAGLPMRAYTGRFLRLRRGPLARSRGDTRRKNMVAHGFQIHKFHSHRDDFVQVSMIKVNKERRLRR